MGPCYREYRHPYQYRDFSLAASTERPWVRQLFAISFRSLGRTHQAKSCVSGHFALILSQVAFITLSPCCLHGGEPRPQGLVSSHPLSHWTLAMAEGGERRHRWHWSIASALLQNNCHKVQPRSQTGQLVCHYLPHMACHNNVAGWQSPLFSLNRYIGRRARWVEMSFLNCSVTPER